MIQMYHVYKSYGKDSFALSDITISIKPRESCFLTGPSGAGKTTFLRLIFREDLSSKGQIIVNGRNVSAIGNKTLPFFRRHIGVVFQDFKLIHTKTVFENVSFVLRLLGVSLKERKRRAFEVLQWVGLHHKMNSFPLELSGGEQQRVAIARALINRPALLLADEPTGNLDPDLSFEIMELFREVNARGTTVVIATHDKHLISAFGGRIILLDKGHLIDDGT